MQKALLVLAIVVISFFYSVSLAKYTLNTDFPAFYRTATIIIDPAVPNVAIYDRDLSAERHDYQSNFVEYRYSMLIAYLMVPLAYLPYNAAKTVMIFVNILAYLGAVAITLRLLGAPGRWFAYPLAISVLWPPFIQNMRFAQTNSIIFLLVVAGVYFAVKNRPSLCGALIGFACLFKVFPVAIALVLGLKNWRVLAGCVGVFGIALLLPGTQQWFASFLYQPFLHGLYSPILKLLGYYGFAVFSAVVALATACIAYRHKNASYLTLACLAIPAMFLTMPIIEQFHLVFLVLPLLYAFLSASRWANVLTAMSIPLVILGGWYAVLGLFVLYVALIKSFINKPQDVFTAPSPSPATQAASPGHS